MSTEQAPKYIRVNGQVYRLAAEPIKSPHTYDQLISVIKEDLRRKPEYSGSKRRPIDVAFYWVNRLDTTELVRAFNDSGANERMISNNFSLGNLEQTLRNVVAMMAAKTVEYDLQGKQ